MFQFGIRDNLRTSGAADKRGQAPQHAKTVLREQPTWADVKIAGLCGASDQDGWRDPAVNSQSTLDFPKSTHRVGRDGRVLNTEKVRAPHLPPGFSRLNGAWTRQNPRNTVSVRQPWDERRELVADLRGLWGPAPRESGGISRRRRRKRDAVFF